MKGLCLLFQTSPVTSSEAFKTQSCGLVLHVCAKQVILDVVQKCSKTSKTIDFEDWSKTSKSKSSHRVAAKNEENMFPRASLCNPSLALKVPHFFAIRPEDNDSENCVFFPGTCIWDFGAGSAKAKPKSHNPQKTKPPNRGWLNDEYVQTARGSNHHKTLYNNK